MLILFLTQLSVRMETLDGVEITGEKPDRKNFLQFIREAMTIVDWYVRDNLETVVVYADVDLNTMQDLTLSSLHSSVMPLYVLNQSAPWGDNMPTRSAAFVILSDSGDVSVFMDHLDKFPLLLASWKKHETLNSFEISTNTKCNKFGKSVVAERFNTFLSEGKSIDVTNPNNEYEKSSFNAMGYPVTCPAFNYPPFSSLVTKSTGEKEVSGIMCIFSVMLFNIVLNNAYAGSFTSFLTVPRYYSDTNTIAGIEKRGLYVGLSARYGSNVLVDLRIGLANTDPDDKPSSLLWSRFVRLDTLGEGLSATITHRNLSVLHFFTGALYEVSKSEYYLHSRPLLHIVEQNVFNLYLAVITRREFPFLTNSIVSCGL
ncbi:hypothetical protein PR048_019392 [Dryococelus australis]|uniref:Uncharacterized protein n=1 Tax=Dryococelus australis TaxID=614101 RepID=A0ABQ9H3C9_9NEOP|nr:hypothetical protein PR048_019392 [Dryococelus australis]